MNVIVPSAFWIGSAGPLACRSTEITTDLPFWAVNTSRELIVSRKVPSAKSLKFSTTLRVDVPGMPHISSGNVVVELVCSLTVGAAADAPPDAVIVSASAPATTRASFHAVAARPMANRAAVRVPCVRLVSRNR
jgi:hypothetical protein